MRLGTYRGEEAASTKEGTKHACRLELQPECASELGVVTAGLEAFVATVSIVDSKPYQKNSYVVSKLLTEQWSEREKHKRHCRHAAKQSEIMHSIDQQPN